MAYYFVVDTYINEDRDRSEYDEYIAEVKPLIEKYGGNYLVRTEHVMNLSDKRNPQRVIVIEFPSKEMLEACFSSLEYKSIMSKRENSVDSRAIIVPGVEEKHDENSSN